MEARHPALPAEYQAEYAQRAEYGSEWADEWAERIIAQRRSSTAIVKRYCRKARAEKRATAPRRLGTSRPRSRASASRRTASVGGKNPDREPPPPLARTCRGCGSNFETQESRRRYCDDKCKSRTLAAKHRAREHVTIEPDPVLLEHARLAREAIRRGSDPYITLSLLIWPTETADGARDLLAVAA